MTGPRSSPHQRHRPAAAPNRPSPCHPRSTPRPPRNTDYPSATWRRSYARRTGAERSFSTVKDPATTDVRHGWCRLMGLTAITLFLACAFVARNQRVLDAFDDRQANDARRAAAGQPPRSRRRRRRTLADLAAAPP